MKNKNIGGGGVMSNQPDQQKGPHAKMRKKSKKLSNIEKFSSLVSLTQHFTKFIFLEKLIAMLKFSMQNMLLLLLFLSTKQSS